MITLRPYQETFISDLRAAFAAGHRSVLGVAPTGSGKTICFSYMAAAAQAKSLRVGIVAHRTELLDQIGGALERFNVPHGFIAPGRKADPFKHVQVCSVMALARRIERVRDRPFDLLIVDEAHHAAAGTSWHQVISQHTEKRVLGVTATPQRMAGEALSDSFSALVMGPTTEHLIEIGALSKYRAFAPTTPDLHGVGRRMGDFVRAENAAAMDKPTITGDAVSTYLKLARGKRAVVFCVSIHHAEHVAAQFSANGVPAASLDGKMDRTTRRETLARFARGEVPILTSCDIVGEGLDIPAIEVAILLRPTQSISLHLQQIGRALRPVEGKDHALILDHAGNIARHGLPDDPRDWSLDGVKKKPGMGGAGIATTTCKVCFAVYRPSSLTCPDGHAREIEGRKIAEVEGEIEEIDLDAIKRERKVEIARARDLPSLVAVAKARGYRPGWVVNIMKARGTRIDPVIVYRMMG